MKRATAKISPNTNAAAKKRRLLRIGPGMIIALVLSAIVGYRYVQVQAKISQQSKTPPVVERQVVSSTFEEKMGPTPEVSFILDHRAGLDLDASQVKKLEKMQSDWTEFYQPKMRAANAAASKTDTYLADAKGNRRTPVAQIQNEAAPMIAVSREISAARRDYWNRSKQILTPQQQAKLQTLREADWAAKVKKLSDKVRELNK